MSPNTFIAARPRFASTLSARVKSCAMKIETACGECLTAPTLNDKIGLWTWMSEWSNANLAALDGANAGHVAGAAARATAAGQIIGGEGNQG